MYAVDKEPLNNTITQPTGINNLYRGKFSFLLIIHRREWNAFLCFTWQCARDLLVKM